MKTLLTFAVTAGLLAAAAVNYSYDAAGRLVKVDYGAGGSITYTYDAAGNLLSRTVVSAPSAGTSSSAKTTSKGTGQSEMSRVKERPAAGNVQRAVHLP